MRGTGTIEPYDLSELGVGAADQPPSFAPVSVRLDDKPAVRWSLGLLEFLGQVVLACLLGVAAGGVAVILQRAAT